ncbi:hypothetical protein [Niallia sp. NCCP-28]|uniref:hypothetical protein n=1 Tax=Niallia sp. NCCP-28 TaxID=2934712 RepID=UPI002083389A|nr:hypothetical protein [Niallia sp. NCCP-28]GKU82998.1 hypothetical protein NCCP28_23940 [Niallia sp. NCCP-28]
MIGLFLSIIIFNMAAFRINAHLSKKQIAHIWMFTVAFQTVVDVMIDLKYGGYWYFSKDIDWLSLLAVTVLLPPVNMVFLNWYPLNASIKKKIVYFFYWEIFMVGYELLTLLPEPWGYFHYGWWNWWYSALCNPVLLSILLKYYKSFVQ